MKNKVLNNLIQQLDSITLGLKNSQINFEHDGSEMTELIKQLKTDEDVVKLAQKILDALVVDSDYSDGFLNTFGDMEEMNEAMEEMIEDRNEVDDLHKLYTDSLSEDKEYNSLEWESEIDWNYEINRICDELGFTPETWLTLNHFFDDVGYPKCDDEYPFDIEFLYEAFTSVEPEPSLEIVEEFLSGEMDQNSLIYFNIISDLLAGCGEFRSEFKTGSYQGHTDENQENEFFIEELEDELEEECEIFRNICSEAIDELELIMTLPDFLQGYTEDRLESMDLDELKDLFDQIDEINEDYDMNQKEKLEEYILQLKAITKLHDAPEIATEYENNFDDVDVDELEELVDEHGDMIKDKKVHKRMRDHFDEQSVMNRHGFGDMDSPIEEIKYEQNNTEFCINTTSFKRLCQEIIQDYTDFQEFDYEPEFFEALQVVSEDFLINRLEKSNLEAIHADRTHIQPKDMKVVSFILNETKPNYDNDSD
tara:strand:- start:993 stop:2432 length:1440 start_codon:yes stop_codon:yes gene_type:complete